MSRAFRLINSISNIGLAQQDLATVRRLRTMNVVAVLASMMSLSYGIFYAAYDVQYFNTEIAVVVIYSPLYLTSLLLTRRGWLDAAMWWGATIAFVNIALINWLLGVELYGLGYLFISPMLLALMTRAGDNRTGWFFAFFAAALVVVVVRFAPAGSVASLPETFRLVFLSVNVFGAILLVTGISLFFRRLIHKAETELVAERQRSDQLLRAILPDPVAEQLKADESKIIAESFPDTTAIFADIVGFTKRSAEVDASLLVAELNRLFSRIDELAGQRGIEKIKTIGDAYFAVCGVPQPVVGHAEKIADFALDLMEVADQWQSAIWPDLRLRIAIHTGPVVAGVIGRTKFTYDVWGDTINTTSRLEGRCQPGEILMSQTAAASLPPRFTKEDIGELDLRDKGKISVYRLIGRTKN